MSGCVPSPFEQYESKRAMPSPNTWLPWHELQALRRGLDQAQDAQIMQVVAIVDALEVRGAADEVIADLRPRLAQLRPRRPASFRRLLFMPLDPLIVSAADWQVGSATIPRTALAPLADTVRLAMGSEAEAIDAIIDGKTTKDTLAVNQAASLLWQAAARILPETTLPDTWTEAGLPAAAYPALASNIATLCRQQTTLQALLAEAEIGVALNAEKLCPFFQDASSDDKVLLTMIVALLLAQLPQSWPLLMDTARLLGRDFDKAIRQATDLAIDLLLARLETPGGTEALVVGGMLSEVAAQVRHIAAMLAGPQARLTASDMDQDTRAAILRRLDASCRTRFAAGLDEEFVRPLQQFGGQRDMTLLVRLEEASRALKALVAEASRIGSAETYAALMQQTIAAVKAIGLGGGLRLIDKVRLVEILAGPDEALTMLEPTPAG